MQTEKLTVEQAIEQGYTHFMEEQGERLEKFSSLDDFNNEYFKNKVCFLVDMSNPVHYSLSADAIRDIIADHVAGQEDMVDDDDKLYNIAHEHDYSQLAEELNKKFETKKYYVTTTIQVVF